MKNNIIKFFIYSIGVILFVSFVYVMWTFGRFVNYNLSYKDMVQETIQEMVKPEYLK